MGHYSAASSQRTSPLAPRRTSYPAQQLLPGSLCRPGSSITCCCLLRRYARSVPPPRGSAVGDPQGRYRCSREGRVTRVGDGEWTRSRQPTPAPTSTTAGRAETSCRCIMFSAHRRQAQAKKGIVLDLAPGRLEPCDQDEDGGRGEGAPPTLPSSGTTSPFLSNFAVFDPTNQTARCERTGPEGRHRSSRRTSSRTCRRSSTTRRFAKPHPGHANSRRRTRRSGASSGRWRRAPEGVRAIIITDDENGGFWDHVAPPHGREAGSRADFFGPGSRVPTIIVSPLTRKGHIDHTEYETTSILRLGSGQAPS